MRSATSARQARRAGLFLSLGRVRRRACTLFPGVPRVWLLPRYRCGGTAVGASPERPQGGADTTRSSTLVRLASTDVGGIGHPAR